MDPFLAAFGVTLLLVPVVAAELAAHRERRAVEGQLEAERARADAAERRALEVGQQLQAVQAAARDYLARLPRGPLDDAAAERLLRLTEHAAGAAGPPAAGEHGGRPAVGP